MKKTTSSRSRSGLGKAKLGSKKSVSLDSGAIFAKMSVSSLRNAHFLYMRGKQHHKSPETFFARQGRIEMEVGDMNDVEAVYPPNAKNSVSPRRSVHVKRSQLLQDALLGGAFSEAQKCA